MNLSNLIATNLHAFSNKFSTTKTSLCVVEVKDGVMQRKDDYVWGFKKSRHFQLVQDAKSEHIKVVQPEIHK